MTLSHFGKKPFELVPTSALVYDFSSRSTKEEGVLPLNVRVGSKTSYIVFFVIDTNTRYLVLLGRDWIHANYYIPSTLHQVIILWNGDKMELVQVEEKPYMSCVNNIFTQEI